MPKEESLPTRKKMRKGTHSCFECRRRKIRCIFTPDNQEVCTECFARGSRCIDQEHANPDVIVDHRKNLRERVSRLEALVDTLLEDKTGKSESPSQSRSQADTSSPKAPTLFTRETLPPTPLTEPSSAIFLQGNQRAPSDRGHHIPILSAFEDALNDARSRDPTRKASMPNQSPTADERFTISNTHDDNLSLSNPRVLSAKSEKAKQALIAMLPPYDQLTKLLNSNGDWWQTWRQKCSGTSGTDQTLPEFAANALTTGNVGALGTVVLAVGICSSDESADVDKYIEAVDRWVLADDEYAASLEGMELLILKSKWYADVGQPRRAWIAYRKGLMYAQLMGLHRKRTTSAAHESIWWALYHGDRFLSLLLGLPYGISDSHCDLSLPDMGGKSEYLHPLIVITKLSQLAGRVIDRNQGIAEQSFAWALQLDQELEDLWKRMDPAWLDYSELLSDPESNAAELRERLMGQIVFNQIRVYLHLPFMLKSTTNSRFTYSRTACLNGSREVLRLYQALRTGTVQPLYECKAIDFIGFTAAVLVQLGLLNFGYTAPNANPKEIEADIRLIEISIDIFTRASSEKGGKVAAQSAQVLSKMMGKFKNGGCTEEHPNDEEFIIPYFGTISIKRGGKDFHPMKHGGPRPPGAISPTNSMRSPSTAGSQPRHNNNQSYAQQNVRPLYTPTSENPSSTGSDLFSSANPSQTHSLSLTPKTSISAASTSNFAFNNTSPFATYNGFYNFENLANDDTTSSTTATAHPATTTAAGTTGASGTTAPSLAGANNSSNSNFAPTINDDSMNNFPLPTNNFSWQTMPMDIDQDWSWFLNDASAAPVAHGAAGTGAGGMGGVAGGGGAGGVAAQQTLDIFDPRGFMGFG